MSDLPRCFVHDVPLAYAELGDGRVGELFCQSCEDENGFILGPIGVVTDVPVGMFDGYLDGAE